MNMNTQYTEEYEVMRQFEGDAANSLGDFTYAHDYMDLAIQQKRWIKTSDEEIQELVERSRKSWIEQGDTDDIENRVAERPKMYESFREGAKANTRQAVKHMYDVGRLSVASKVDYLTDKLKSGVIQSEPHVKRIEAFIKRSESLIELGRTGSQPCS